MIDGNLDERSYEKGPKMVYMFKYIIQTDYLYPIFLTSRSYMRRTE